MNLCLQEKQQGQENQGGDTKEEETGKRRQNERGRREIREKHSVLGAVSRMGGEEGKGAEMSSPSNANSKVIVLCRQFMLSYASHLLGVVS